MNTTNSYANMPKMAATLASLQAKVIKAMKQQQELLSKHNEQLMKSKANYIKFNQWNNTTNYP